MPDDKIFGLRIDKDSESSNFGKGKKTLMTTCMGCSNEGDGPAGRFHRLVKHETWRPGPADTVAAQISHSDQSEGERRLMATIDHLTYLGTRCIPR